MDTSYLAGFIDGEGTIGIEKQKSHTKFYYRLHLRIGNTNLDVLKEIQKQFGGDIHFQGVTKGGKKFHAISWFNENAKIILEQIKDKLIIKKEIAEYAIGYPVGEGKGTKVPPMVQELREMLYNIIKTLNR